ncbi:hypothetical protein V8F20_006365 [Naviculisporaceae sp. PSN 640]
MSLGKRPRPGIFFERQELAPFAPPAKKMLIGPYRRTHEMQIVVLSEVQIKAITDTVGGIAPCEDNRGRPTLDYFIDGSLEMRRPGETRNIPLGYVRRGGYAVTSQVECDTGYSQICEGFLMERAFCIPQTEKMGATEALAAALEKVRGGDGKYDGSLVRVFIDSQTSLHQWNQGISPIEYTGEFERDVTRPIDEAAVELWAGLREHGCDVVLYWVPRNSTPEHKIADILSYAVWNGKYFGKPVKRAERREATAGLDAKVEEAVRKYRANERLVHGLQALNI